jgi:hypothetical protein
MPGPHTLASMKALTAILFLVALGAGCGGHDQYSMGGVADCLRGEGLAVQSEPYVYQGGDPDSAVINDALGYRGTIHGRIAGVDFSVDVFDDSAWAEYSKRQEDPDIDAKLARCASRVYSCRAAGDC